jgi:hypothetical protein
MMTIAPVSLIADAGLPMIALTFPAMVILLIPVIVVEALLCRRWLRLSTWQALKSNAVANSASTVVGIPVAWVVMLFVQNGLAGVVSTTQAAHNWNGPLANVIVVVVNSAWLGPIEGSNWAIPMATLVLLIPFFFASYGIEYFVVRSMVGAPEGGPANLAYRRVRIAVRNANLITYGAMFVFTSIWLLASLRPLSSIAGN